MFENRRHWQPRKPHSFARPDDGTIESVVEPELGDVVARFGRPFIEAHPDAIVVACADGRYTIIEWPVLEALELTRVPDYSFAPGGPGGLHPDTCQNPASRTARLDDLQLLIEKHRALRVLLVNHRHCAYYRERFSGKSGAWIAQRQFSDLAEVRTVLGHLYPLVKFECYFAQPKDGHVVIHSVLM